MSILIKRKPLSLIRREDGAVQGLFIGRSGESGIWRSRAKPRRMLLWRDHDSLFIALGRFRLRIMKPSAFQNLGR